MNTGIYSIESGSGTLYIGLTADSFSNRWNGHLKLLRQSKHHCTGLQNAYNKYGESGLSFSIIEEISKDNYDLLLKQELYWWDFYSKNTRMYNGRPTGTGSVFHSEETILRMKNKGILNYIKTLPEGTVYRITDEIKLEILKTCKREGCSNTFFASRRKMLCSSECRSLDKINTKMDKFSYEVIYDLYHNQMLSRREIGMILGIGRSTVGNVMAYLDIPTRNMSEAQKAKR